MAPFAERFIASSDGLRLYARDYAAEGGERGVPVLCLHGLTRNAADFESLAPRVAALGRRVIAVDVRGRGRSDVDPQPERYQGGTYAADVVTLLNALEIPRAVFLGTSMGGLITMIAAVIASDRVAAAVLNDIGPVIDPAGPKRIASYVGKSEPFESEAALIAAVRATQGIAFPDADASFWSVMARRVARRRDDGRFEFAYDPAIARALAPPKESQPAPDLMPYFRALATRPVLVIRGALSDILAPDGVAAMRAVKPDLISAEVPRVGHAPTLDEPAAWSAIAAFLAAVD